MISKNMKNKLITAISILGTGTLLGVGLSILDIKKEVQNEINALSLEVASVPSPRFFDGKTLLKENVIALG